jgi:hypothetical protein
MAHGLKMLPSNCNNGREKRMEIQKKYLNEKQVAEITCRAVQSLRNDRSLGKGVPFVRIGRSVRYSLEDVVRHMESHKVQTEDY